MLQWLSSWGLEFRPHPVPAALEAETRKRKAQSKLAGKASHIGSSHLLGERAGLGEEGEQRRVTVTAASGLYMYVYILTTHTHENGEKETHTTTPLRRRPPSNCVYKQLVSTLCVFIDHRDTHTKTSPWSSQLERSPPAPERGQNWAPLWVKNVTQPHQWLLSEYSGNISKISYFPKGAGEDHVWVWVIFLQISHSAPWLGKITKDS